MTNKPFDQVRDKDYTVIECISEGHDTTRTIREQTTFSNRDVNYSLDKLEDLGLIETETPDGRVTEVVDGQKRKFKAPRKAELTDSGEEYFARNDGDQDLFRDLSHDELVIRVRKLEVELEDVQNRMEAFRQQVLEKL